MCSGGANFTYYGKEDTPTEVNDTTDPSGLNATVVIKRIRPSKFAIEGICGSIFHYVFLKKGEHCIMLKLCAISPLILI